MMTKSWILIVMGLLMAMPVKADYDYIGWGGAPMYDSGFFMNSALSFSSFTNATTLNNAWKNKGLAKPASKNAKLTLAPSAKTALWPKKLANKFPKEQRKEWERAFKFSLNTYEKLAKKLKIPKNDVAGAVAAYIAGNYMAYHDTEVSDRDFLALVGQVRSLLIKIPKFTKAKKSAKRDLYELMAIGGMFMAIANLDLQQQPDQSSTDKLQLVAKENLEQFFRADIDDIKIIKGRLVIQ
jgi:hypothetical protein